MDPGTRRSSMNSEASFDYSPHFKKFNPKLRTEVHTDASNDGTSGMLLQFEDDVKHVVAYFSRQTTSLESCYHSY
jgi:hypothetical protein